MISVTSGRVSCEHGSKGIYTVDEDIGLLARPSKRMTLKPIL